MSAVAIAASSLSKAYRIQHHAERPTRATEAIMARLRHPFSRSQVEVFPALDDVSFEIPWGAAVGIIGRNGAGKSTLLKILTQVTAPTDGRVELGGRVGSLLEVGTGFHPELTGRENVFLNGTLLGMRKKELVRRFDEIVAFSGVEKFLDTPVKRYSSGMYVRLAFSVAAHLDTEILAIDEVLAVGDADFQARCLEKMREAAKDGRTVLFVSHQLQTVSALCTEAMHLERGRLMVHGSVDEALASYRATLQRSAVQQLTSESRPGTGELRFTRAGLQDRVVEAGRDIEIDFEVGGRADFVGSYFVSCHINDVNGSVIAQCDSRLSGFWAEGTSPLSGRLVVRGPWLKPGPYSVDLFLCQSGVLDSWERALTFDVLPVLPYPYPGGDEAIHAGLVLADFDYERR